MGFFGKSGKDMAAYVAEARADERAWVGRGKSFGPDVRNYWRRQMQENVVACTRYHMHECVAIFSYVCEVIDELW